MLRNNGTIIAAVNTLDSLDTAIRSRTKTIFLLTGTINDLSQSINKIRCANKCVYIDADLMEGFGRDAAFLQYVREVLKPEGIITTKSTLVRIAKSLDMSVIQRIFAFDSKSLNFRIDSVNERKPDAVEILPGIVPKIIRDICGKVAVPVLSGGLIESWEDVENALKAGAVAITTSNPLLWDSD